MTAQQDSPASAARNANAADENQPAIRAAVTVSLVPEATGGPFVFWNGLADACEQAAKLGFDAIEIFPPSAAEVDRSQLRELLDRFHLRVAAVGTGGGWLVRRLHLCHSDALRREGARQFIHDMIDLAAEFAAPAILGSMQGRAEGGVSRTDALTLLQEALIEFDAHAARLGCPFFVEPLNRYETNLWNRVSDVSAVIDALKLSSARVLADLFHMNIEEDSTPDALRTAGKKNRPCAFCRQQPSRNRFRADGCLARGRCAPQHRVQRISLRGNPAPSGQLNGGNANDACVLALFSESLLRDRECLSTNSFIRKSVAFSRARGITRSC